MSRSIGGMQVKIAKPEPQNDCLKDLMNNWSQKWLSMMKIPITWIKHLKTSGFSFTHAGNIYYREFSKYFIKSRAHIADFWHRIYHKLKRSSIDFVWEKQVEPLITSSFTPSSRSSSWRSVHERCLLRFSANLKI